MIFIRHKDYQFVQPARCKHCKCFVTKRVGHDFAMYCFFKRTFRGSMNFCCDSFDPKDHFVIVNQVVQLNLF